MVESGSTYYLQEALAMLISKNLTAALNEQIGYEFFTSMQYTAIACYFGAEALPELAKHFTLQAEEERVHALKLVNYVVDSGGKMIIPTIPSPQSDFKTAEEAWPLIQERGVKVLLTDLHFAGMKGGELIARVQDAVPTAAVFAMTGYHAAAAEVKDRLDHIFYKPFFPSQVAAHVHLALLGQRYRGQ